jgi:glutamine amidotransferase
VCNRPVDLKFSLERFKEFANWNPDGWGIGWYENKESKIFKQGIPATAKESELSVLSREVRSKIIIAHVRRGTDAEPSEQNSHPFNHENWIFAHNGEVNREHLLSLLKDEYKNRLEGETDSEVYFYLLLQCIEEEGNIIREVKKAVKKAIERTHGGLNFLLSDGRNLYAFRYSGYSRSYHLYKLRRDPSKPEPIKFLSKETKALIHSKSLKGEKAVLVCSEKLTEEKWEEICFGNLLIVKPNLSIEEVRIL